MFLCECECVEESRSLYLFILSLSVIGDEIMRRIEELFCQSYEVYFYFLS